MVRLILVAGLLGLVVSTVAQADLEKGDFAPDIEAADWMNTDGKSLSLAELRGMVVVLYFWESYQAVGEKLLPIVNLLDHVPSLGRGGGVFTLGVTSADRKTVEDFIKKKRIFFPIALNSKAAAAYKIKQFPHVVILDPNGAVAYTGLGSPDAIVNELKKLFQESPPFRTHPYEVVKAEKALSEAREALKQGDYGEAILKAREADEHALQDDQLKVRCQQLMDLVDAVGRDRLHQGLALLYQNQIDAGVQIVHDVITKFQLVDCGKTARRRMRFLKEHYPEIQRAVDKIEREDKARTKLTEVAEKLWQRKYGDAYDRLKKVEAEFAGTKAAETAKTIRGSMDANKPLMQNVRDQQARVVCEDRLARARNQMALGRHDEARKLLRSIIDEFPDTRYEEEAYKLLAEIPT